MRIAAISGLGVVNRCAVGVLAREPLRQWVQQIDPDGQDAFGHEPTLYLIPEFDTDQEGEKVLKECYSWIFEQELYSWCTDVSCWPQQRSFELFQQWFEVTSYPLVEDLVGNELRNEPTAEDVRLLAGVKRLIE